MDNADAWVMEMVVEPEADLHLQIRAMETRLVLTEGAMYCKDVVLTRNPLPEAIHKVKLAYLIPVMVVFGLLALLFIGATIGTAIIGNLWSAVLLALTATGWCVFSWKNMLRLWHSDRKTKK
jgi:hypothetical protein